MAKQTHTYDKGRTEEERGRFIIFFLTDDENQSVNVEEVEEVDFFEVAQHLRLGGSVFITRKRKPRFSLISRRTTSAKDFELLEREEEYYSAVV